MALENRTLIQYGNYRFNELTETTNLVVRPEYDQAQRTAVANFYEITLYTTIANTNDVLTRSIIQQLSKPAYTFIYRGTGLGVAVNIGNATDLNWGPKPQVVNVKPLGGGRAVGLTWTVQLSVPDFAGHENYRRQPMEFNYGLTFDIDESGYTKRIYSGYVRIPMTRNGGATNRRLPDSVDRYREEIDPPHLENFRRTTKSFTVSPDKRTLDFNIVDEELRPNVPPPDVIKCEASHTTSSTPGKLYEWTSTLQASYEVIPGRAASAIRAFFNLLRDRVGWSMQTLKIPGGPSVPQSPPGAPTGGGAIQNEQTKPSIIPISFTMAEPDLYGNTRVNLTCVYRINGASLKEMLGASGLWRPAPDSNYKLWHASVKIAESSRGYAQLMFRPGDDSIVDLGETLISIDLSNGGGRDAFPPNGPPPGTFPPPHPATSWLSWKNSIHLEANNGLMKVSLLNEDKGKRTDLLFAEGINGVLAAAGGAAGGVAKLPTESSFFFEPPPDAAKADIQQRSQWAYLTMEGSATRAGYKIESPTLLKWGDQTLYPANRTGKGEGFWIGVVGNAGVPIWGARWKLRFFCPKIPSTGDLPIPQDPFRSGS